MVPNGWEVKSPSKLFKLFSGFAFKSSDAKESGAKWLKIANVGIGEIKWDADSFLPEHFLLEHKKYLLTKGDIVVALTRPTLGNKLKVARLTKDSDTSLLNQRVAKIVCKDNVDSEFTFQVLRSDQFAFRINVGLLGTDPPNLSVKVLEDFTIPVPPLPEQRKIAQILSTWDKAIATTEKLIDASKQQKKALMQQLLTGKKRLLDPETGKAFEGEWEEVKLGQCSTCLDNKRVPLNSEQRSEMKGTYPYWGANGIVDYVNEYIFDESIVLLAEDGGYFDEYATRPIANISYGKCWVNNHAHIIKGKKNATNEWLYFSLVHKNILAFINGGTRAKLNKKDMLLIKVLLPSVKEQQKITSVLSNADKETELLKAKLAHLKQEKKALMQQLLTGKRRVSLSS
ncbi:restriction endonuclease subunit S [Vibrio alginolyticus]|uniref:restriction endonuclease subunit S n=1 Tax=Vibrio alginolyticus TaxID=663 RepID=UPI003752D9A8